MINFLDSNLSIIGRGKHFHTFQYKSLVHTLPSPGSPSFLASPFFFLLRGRSSLSTPESRSRLSHFYLFLSWLVRSFFFFSFLLSGLISRLSFSFLDLLHFSYGLFGFDFFLYGLWDLLLCGLIFFSMAYGPNVSPQNKKGLGGWEQI